MPANTTSYFIFHLSKHVDISTEPKPEWPPVEPTPIPPVTEPIPTVPPVNGAHFQFYSFALN